ALDESLLPTMDVFVTTADPDREPPLVTVNTILSILAADYPAHRFTCYVSDDGGAPVTREAVAEAARFAGRWRHRQRWCWWLQGEGVAGTGKGPESCAAGVRGAAAADRRA